MTTEAKITVCIVEDDEDLRQIMTMALADFGFDVRGYAGSREFYRDLLRRPCDIALLDVNLPGEDGFSIMEHLRAGSDVGIIMLTARDRTEDRVHALTRGADIYLTKPVQLEELAANIGSLARRLKGRRTPAPAAAAGWRLSADGWSLLTPAGESVTLTGSERALLETLLRHADEAVSRDRLIEALGHRTDYFLGNRLDMLISRLRRKVVDETGRHLPLRTIRGVGFSLLPMAPDRPCR